MAIAPDPDPARPVAEPTRAGTRRCLGVRARPPRRAVPRFLGGVGRGGGRRPRALHHAPLPPWPGRTLDELASRLARECEWLVENDVLPDDVVTPNRRLAETALRPWTPVFIHGDLQIDHVFVAGDEITGVIDWSEGARGDPLYDLATLTLGHPEHLGDVIAGYGTHVDRDLIRAWWSWRCLTNVRWLVEHGYGPPEDYPEVLVLRQAVMPHELENFECLSTIGMP